MEVIKALYTEVFVLEEWLYQADYSGTLKAGLLKEEDTQRDLVKTTIVGVPESTKQQSVFTLSQNSHQREVVLRVIEKLIKKDGAGKNILTLGFGVMSDDAHAHISSTGVSVEYRYPNSNVNRLHFKVWKQLLARIGDDLMMHLLEKTSIFILLAPTCYLQLTGLPLYNAWPYEYGKTLAVRQTHNTSTNKRKKKWSRNKRTDSLSSKKPEVVTQAESDKTVVIVVSSNTDNKTNETNHKETKNKEAKAESDKTVTSIVSAKTDNKTNETNCKETKNKEAKAQSDKAVTSVVSTSHSVNQSKLSIENKGIARKQPISRKRKANNIDSEQDDAFEGVSKKPRTNTDSEQDDLHKSVSKKPRTNTDSEQDDVHEPVRTNTDSEQVDTHEPVSKKPRTNTDSEQDDIHEPVRTNTDSEQDEFHEPVSKKPRQANYVDIPSNVIRKTVLKEVNTDQTNASQEINVVNVNNLTDNNKTISKETSKTSSVKRKMEGSCMGQTSVRGASILSTTVLNKETKFQTVANVKRADIEGVNGWDKNDKRLSTQFDMAGQNTEGPTRSIKEQTRTPRPYDHLMYLQRSSILYNRNIREKLPKSTVLASLCSLSGSARCLYKYIFCDTSVHSSDPPIEVISPSIPTAVTSDSESSTNNASISIEENDTRMNLLKGHPSFFSSNSNESFEKGLQNQSSLFNSEQENATERIHVHQAHVNGANSNDDLFTMSDKVHFLDSSGSAENSNVSFEKLLKSQSRLFSSEQENVSNTVKQAHSYDVNSCVDLSKMSDKVLTLVGSTSYTEGVEPMKTAVNTKQAFKLEMLKQRKQAILIQKQKILPAILQKNNNTICNSAGPSEETDQSESRSKQINGSLHEVVNSVRTQSDNYLKKYGTISLREAIAHSLVQHNGGAEVDEQTKEMVGETTGINHHKMSNDNIKEMKNGFMRNKGENQTNSCKLKEGNANTALLLQSTTETRLISSQSEEKPMRKTEIIARSIDRAEVDLDDKVAAKTKEIVRTKVHVIDRLLDLLEEFRNFHRKCPYKVLLRHHCPILVKEKGGKSSLKVKNTNKSSTARLLGDHIHHRNVYLFLRACFLKTFPLELLGASHNRNVILKNISMVVSMGKFEKLCLGQLMTGLKTSEISWLQDLPTNNLKLHLLAKLIYWIFKDYIFILLKTYFYITETTFIKYRLLYYRQSVWNRLYIQGFTGLLQRKIMKPLKEDQGIDMIKKGTSLGVSVLRFLPKQGSLRPIVNMGKTAGQLGVKKLSINQQLTDLMHILKYLKNENPSLVGAGKFGMDDIYKSWVQYCKHWKNLGRPKLYFVKTDITNCYDSILQDKLYSILENVFQQHQEDYVVRKYATVMVTGGNLKRSFHRIVTPLTEYEPDFARVAKEMIRNKRMHDVILVDKVLHQHETGETVLQLLNSHLFNNIIKVGLKYYQQSLGISQGSVLSTLLCSIYYADMEREYMEIGEDDLLMRIVDDYLYVTPSLESATKFLNLMLQGIPEYNCHINVEKVLTNFKYKNTRVGPISSVKDMFPWCGMIFNTNTLEVQVDYSRYSGYRISDSITFELCHKPGIAMKKKILFSSRPKCHAMFTDSTINSYSQICINCYQLFLLSAHKFSAYNLRLSHKQRADSNPDFFYGIVCDLSKYVYNQARKELTSIKMEGTSTEGFLVCRDTLKCGDPDEMLHYAAFHLVLHCLPKYTFRRHQLCLKAFQSVLGQHHSLYKEILKQIRKDLQILDGKQVSGKAPLLPDVLTNLNKQFAEVLE